MLVLMNAPRTQHNDIERFIAYESAVKGHGNMIDWQSSVHV